MQAGSEETLDISASNLDLLKSILQQAVEKNGTSNSDIEMIIELDYDFIQPGGAETVSSNFNMTIDSSNNMDRAVAKEFYDALT